MSRAQLLHKHGDFQQFQLVDARVLAEFNPCGCCLAASRLRPIHDFQDLQRFQLTDDRGLAEFDPCKCSFKRLELNFFTNTRIFKNFSSYEQVGLHTTTLLLIVSKH